MFDKRLLEQIFSEQAEELVEVAEGFRCRRKEEDLINLNSKLAQVVIGVRRSGKSTLCLNALLSAGVNFAYANFDDERLAGMDAGELNNVLEVLYKLRGDFTHLFLDEIQNVEGWHLFVNRMLRRGMKVVLTGSNAKLLGGELATHLTGRHNTIVLYPFSFRDFCAYLGVDAEKNTTRAEAARRAAFDRYLMQGGFPELFSEPDNKRYVSELVDDILARDICQRHSIRHFDAFEKLAHYVMNVSPAVLSPAELTKTFGFGSAQTTNNYLNYLVQAYLLVKLRKFSTKSRVRITEEKAYAVDMAIMDNRPDAMRGPNLGWRMETAVYLELCRRKVTDGTYVYYYKSGPRAKEVDFVVCRGNSVVQLYQVAYDISAPKTRKREIDSLVMAAEALKCRELYLLTDTERGREESGGKVVEIVPVYEWLLHD